MVWACFALLTLVVVLSFDCRWWSCKHQDRLCYLCKYRLLSTHGRG